MNRPNKLLLTCLPPPRRAPRRRERLSRVGGWNHVFARYGRPASGVARTAGPAACPARKGRSLSREPRSVPHGKEVLQSFSTCGTRTEEKDTTMQYRILQPVLVVALVVGISGCAGISGRDREKKAAAPEVSLSNLPEPVRATVERLFAGGEIKKLDKEVEEGKVIYDLEGKVQGKDVEFDIASDGSVLSAEESVSYSSLPGAVQAAVEKYFGSAQGLEAFKEVEHGKTFYEVEGKKDGAPITLKLTDMGQILEVEKE